MNTILPFALPPGRAIASAPALLDPLPRLHEEPEAPVLPDADPEAWRPALLGQLLAAETAAMRRRTVRTLMCSLGFDSLVYGRFTRQGDHWLPHSFCTTYADVDWLQRYVCASYHRVDPRLAAALQSSLPCVWTLEGLQREAEAQAPASLVHAFVDDLRASGMQSGVLLALPAPDPGPHAVRERPVLGLCARAEGRAWLNDALLGQVLTLGFCLHELYSRHLPPAADAAGVDTLPELPPLQREILACVARGLGDKQIASQLSLSPHNVDYHLRQLRRRFSVRNRVQLTQAALRSGLR